MYIKVLLSIFSWLLDYYSNNSMVYYAFEEVLFFDDRSTTDDDATIIWPQHHFNHLFSKKFI